MNSKIWNKDFTILFVVNIIAFLGLMMLNPNMAEYAARLGGSPGMLGTVTAVMAFAALASRPFSGRAADRIDNKKLVLLALSGIAASLIAYSFADSLLLLLMVRFLHGLAIGLSTTLLMAMASRTLPPERMGAGISIFGLGIIFSMTFTPALGIYITELFGIDMLFYSTATLTALTIVLAFFLNPQVPARQINPGQPFWASFFVIKAAGPATVALLNSIALGTVNTFLLLLAKERDVADIGLYFTVTAVVLLATRPLLARFMDRPSLMMPLIPCSILLIASMILIAAARNLPIFLLAAILAGIGNGGMQPALQTLSLRNVGLDRRGAASGTYFIGLDIGNAVGPLLTGILAASLGYGGAFLLLIIPLCLGLGVIMLIGRKKANEMSSTDQIRNSP